MNKKLKTLKIILKVKRKLNNLFGNSPKQVYLGNRIEQYEKIWQTISSKLGADIVKLDRDLWEISKNKKSLRVRLHEFPLDNNIVLKICGRKPLVHKLLSEQNIPVPSHVTFTADNYTNAIDFFNNRKNSVVVKPCDGYAGLGVTTHIDTIAELEKAIVIASLYDDTLMIEEQIVGENYRILIYKGKILHAVRRTGQHVTGDGKSTIKQLINLKPNEVSNDDDLIFTLSAQDIKLEDIPEKNKKVLIRSVGSDFNGGAELRTIYDTVVTEDIHDSVAEDAINSTNVVGALLSGVDIITTDLGKNLRDTGGIINEVNTTPALHHHYDINTEKFPEPAHYILNDLLNN